MSLKKTIYALSVLVLLAGCASQLPPRPGVVRDRISEEMQQALAERRIVDSADKALMPPLAVQLPGNGQETGGRFDLSVVNAPATQVFMAIVNGTRYNMLVGPEVSGQITVNLKDVTVKEALEAIRDLYGYEFQIKGNRISIQPNTIQTRMFQVNYLASRRQGNTDLRVTSSAIVGTGPVGGTNTGMPTPSTSGTTTPVQGSGSPTSATGNLTSRVQTSSDNDFWRDITTAMNTLIGGGEGRSVVINPISGVILVKALPSELRAIEGYLKATQVVVDRQVMLEAKIIEVSLNQNYQAGINWAAFGNASNNSGSGRSALGVSAPGTILNTLAANGSPTAFGNSDVSVLPGRFGGLSTASTGAGFFGLALQTASFSALLNFLEGQGDVQVLSSPRIATINNQKAVLKVGTDDLFVTNVTTNTTSTTTGSVSTPSLTLQSYFSGISLDVTPQIDEDNNVILHVHPAVTQVVEKEKVIDLGTVLGTYKLPLASSSVNETDSIVRVQDGNIVAIGGLMKQKQTSNSSGLPGTTGSAAGTLLGQRGSSMSKTELVILIKPTIIGDDKAWVQDLEQVSQRLRGLDGKAPDPTKMVK
ncbi:secretin N-terminal domain-containing protein [Denitratisoma sp. DHT3]|uniref:secretin N-terminal domain-containing protein n=1 Tax=Denitratisoma sp. DHT3 TaxID=1981880 RepID=UPI0021BD0AA7|nr:secretin N-terminal domain-containing protein [Denitratisoma sp. DHT3]